MRDYANVKKKKRSKDNKTIYYYSLQQLQLDPDSRQWQLKQQPGKRLLDWIGLRIDKCNHITADKEEQRRNETEAAATTAATARAAENSKINNNKLT